MRKIAVLVALVLCASMAWADAEPVATPRAQDAQSPPAFGTIRSINANELILADALGQQWTFLVNEQTQAQRVNPGERTTSGAPASLAKIQLADLKPGMLVHVQYSRSGPQAKLQAQRVVAQQTPVPTTKEARPEKP